MPNLQSNVWLRGQQQAVSQGAKPGHGGILPGAKVTEEIAEARLVPIGETVFSPTYHQQFWTPLEMMAFIAQLRELCGGKPVGFKICIGEPREFMGIVEAMLETGVRPDFIGGEGGTGAAPSPRRSHSVPTCATRHAGSCSPSGASRPSAATRTPAQSG